MSGSIGTLIYGIPLNKHLCEVIGAKSFDSESTYKLEELGFQTLYHASESFPVGFFGAKLYQFSASSGYEDLDDLTDMKGALKEKDKRRVDEEFQKLPGYVKENTDEPGFYIVWSSS